MKAAAQAVIDRWDSPDWKDGTHTADYIDALRKALAAPPVAEAIPAQDVASIDTAEFLDLACKFAHESSCEEFNEAEYAAAHTALIDHINAYGQHQRNEGAIDGRIHQRGVDEKAMAVLRERAEKAEAELEEWRFTNKVDDLCRRVDRAEAALTLYQAYEIVDAGRAVE